MHPIGGHYRIASNGGPKRKMFNMLKVKVFYLFKIKEFKRKYLKSDLSVTDIYGVETVRS